MMILLAVAGGLGAAARFVIDTVIARHNKLSVPIGTLVINFSACFLLGLLTGWGIVHPGHNDVHAVLGIGFLGGYSTFSTATVEGARLILAGRGLMAVLHPMIMLVGCLLASAAGVLLTGS